MEEFAHSVMINLFFLTTVCQSVMCVSVHLRFPLSKCAGLSENAKISNGNLQFFIFYLENVNFTSENICIAQTNA